MTDIDVIWIEAAEDSFADIQSPMVASEAAVNRLAMHIEEMASMDPVERRSYPDAFEGDIARAMQAWIADTDESDGY